MGSTLILCDGHNGIGLAKRLARNGTVCKVHIQPDQGYLLDSANPSVIGKLSMLEQYDLILNQTNGFTDTPHTMCNSPFCQLVQNEKDYFTEVAKLLDVKIAVTCDFPLFVTGWFDGETFRTFTASISYNREHDGGRGRKSLPFQAFGRVTWHLPECDLTRPLTTITKLLQKVAYHGPITFVYEIAPDGFYLLMILPQFFTYETFELFRGNEFDLLWQLKMKQPIELTDQYAISVSILCYGKPQTKVVEFDDGAERHTFLDNLGLPQMLATNDPWLGQVTARSQTVHEARRRAYRTVQNCICTPDVFYRTDIGCDVESKISKLKEWGHVHV